MMKKSYLLLAFICGISALQPAPGISDSAEPITQPAQAAAPSVFRTLDIGAQSGCVRPGKLIITDEKEWQRVWVLHTSIQKIKFSPPPVDFTKQAVVALMLGEQPAGASIETVQILNGRADTTIYYSVQRGQKGGAGVGQPFHFAMIDKPVGPVRFASVSEECAACVVR